MQVPPPRGNVPVGTTTFSFVDSARPDPWVPTERRVVVVRAWYPAALSDRGSRADYLPRAGELPGPFSRGERWAAARLASHSFADAPVATSPSLFPAIVFSPGNDMAVEYYSGVLEELASRGYVVLALDHAHEGKGQLLADGRRLESEVERHRPRDAATAVFDFSRFRVDARVADASAVLDRIAQRSPAVPLASRIDIARIGALGHSIGGMAAAEMCRRDRRVRACANLDGLIGSKPILPDSTGGFVLPRPFLFLGKPLPFRNPAVNDSAKREIQAAIQSGAGGYDVTIDGTAHLSYSDSPFLTPTFRPTMKRADLEIVRDVTLAFFDKTLLGRIAAVLDDSATLRSGRVRIARLTPTKG
jgi:dienelactone hydrolase